MMRRVIAAISLIVLSLSLQAQDDFGTWSYVTVSKSVGKGFGLFFRAEHRSKATAKELDLAMFMPGVTYHPADWVTFGLIYDFVLTKSAKRNLLLPYVSVSKSFGGWSLSLREMGQYVFETNTFLLRTKLMAQYSIGEKGIVRPTIYIEPYTRCMEVSSMTNFVGSTFKIAKRSRLEVGYIYNYRSSGPSRHLVSAGYTLSL